MASIVKRKKAYSVIYSYTNEEGESKQKWETWHTYAEAKRRKAEIENQQATGTFVAPSKQTVAEFMFDFVKIYGEKRWGIATYDGNCGLIANYINPIIGDLSMQEVTNKVADYYIKTLQQTPSVVKNNRSPRTKYLSPGNIDKILTLLRCAFNQAVRWDIIGKNPFLNASGPKVEYQPRDFWTAEMISKALDHCRDSKLYIAMNLAFACSMRMGEILGLSWDNVHISDKNIANGDAFIYIDRELERASKRAIETLAEKDVLFIFPPLMSNTSTRLVIKRPKTKSSIRKVWMPPTVAHILREWKKSQDELKAFLGEEYQDFNLVVAQANGRPCESRIIEKEFLKLREEAELPRVVFHSLRHSSTTYKLKYNGGDLKATQGDTGHAELDMITKVYAHILDEDRKLNAQKFETMFYSNPDLRNAKPPVPAPALDLNQLVEQLKQSPELASALASLLQGSGAL